MMVSRDAQKTYKIQNVFYHITLRKLGIEGKRVT